MPSEIRVVDQKFFYQLRNGDTFSDNTGDFTRHLKGNILEKVKAVFNVQLNWYIRFQGNGVVGYYYDTTPSTDTLTLTANGSNFIANGFAIGDTFKYSDVAWKFEGVITALSETELRADVTSVTGTPVSDAWDYTGEPTFLTGTTTKTALEYKFGLIEQNEFFNTLSKLTNTDQIYRVSGIDHNTPLTFADGESFGNNKAWVTGNMKCAFVGLTFDKDEINTENTTQEFQIEHEFVINPFYRDGELDSLNGIDTPPLDIFNGNKSLKYVFQTEFRTEISNPNSSMIADYDTQLGSVGYFDENYNGFPNNYSDENLTYTVGGNSADRIESTASTTVSFDIIDSQGNFSANTQVILGHVSIIGSDKYLNSPKEYNDLWNNENIRVKVLDPAVSGNYIKNASATVSSASLITVTFDVDLTTAETQNGQNYIIYYGIEEEDLSPDLSGKITGLADVNFYFKNTDVTGLWNTIKFEQYPHAEPYEQGVTSGFTNAKGFNETGYFLDATFLKVANAELIDLKFQVVVYNTATQAYYVLREYQFDLSDSITTPDGTQRIEIDETRGYVLTDDDLFNSVFIETIPTSGGAANYNIKLGYKTPWQEWNAWRDAPLDFYDNTKPNNNLNDLTSNYSDNISNYEVRVFLDAGLEFEGSVTKYVISSEKFDVFDYDTDDEDPDAFSCVINTFNNLGTPLQNNIIEQEFTEVRAVFTPLNPPTFSENVDFTEVSTQWGRFAHGEKLTTAFLTLDRIPNWSGGQADDNDIFGDNIGNTFNKNSADLYTSTPNQILSEKNLGAFYGCSSLLEYNFYTINGKMFSNDSDNDGIAYIIAFNTDADGNESTLSLVATTGGIFTGLNPAFDVNNPESGLVDSFQLFASPTPSANWALVYNFGKRDCQIIDSFATSSSANLGWNNAAVEDLNFEVNRIDNDIEVIVDWTIETVDYSNTFNYNLLSNSFTEKFAGFQRIGFAFNSQNQGGFKDVVLTLATSDYYGILRIEPENAPSDFSINELSTVREAPEGNFLTQVTGTEKKANLVFAGGNFILQGLVDTSQITEGQNYKLSAELRSLNLDQ
jgi:hypothetical protein